MHTETIRMFIVHVWCSIKYQGFYGGVNGLKYHVIPKLFGELDGYFLRNYTSHELSGSTYLKKIFSASINFLYCQFELEERLE